MTMTDIIFLYFCVLAVRQLAWAMKDWEYRDHDRILQARDNAEWWKRERELMGQTINCRCAYVQMLEYGKSTNPESDPIKRI